MQRIGRITSAMGLIFLGIWMMVNMRNPVLGRQLLRWWPILIILLGIEILYSVSKIHHSDSIRISGLIIPIVLIFLVVNGLSSLSYTMKKWNSGSIIGDFFTHTNFTDEFNHKWRMIEKNITLEPFGNALTFEATNGDIRIEKSKNDKITLENKIYVDSNIDMDKFQVNAAKEDNGYSVKILDNSIKSIKTTIYIPDTYSLSLIGTNMQIKSEDSIKLSNLKIKINNGNVKLQGQLPNSSIKIDNGKLDLNNELCENINITLLNGSVSLHTKDKNIAFNTDITWGPCIINGEKRVNAGISTKTGTGKGKVDINVNNGSIRVKSNEE